MVYPMGNIRIQKVNCYKWRVLLDTPYSKELVATIKKHIRTENRQFDWQKKVWILNVADNNKKQIRAVLESVNRLFNAQACIDFTDFYFGKLSRDGNLLLFRTQYSNKFIADIKEKFNNRKWESSNDAWIVKITSLEEIKSVHEILEKYNIKIDKETKKYLEHKEKQLKEEKKKFKEIYQMSKKKSIESEYDVELPDDSLTLRPFQKYAVKRLDLQMCGLLADEMGLGKTVEVLAHLYNYKKLRPVIVIVPSSAKLNWKYEIEKWTGESNITIIEGQSGDIPDDSNWYIVNYAVLYHRLEQMKQIDYSAVIIDESHYIKNKDAQRSKAATALTEKIDTVYCLSGTPIKNKPVELWQQLKVLDAEKYHEDFKDFWRFAKKYCNAHENKWGWDVNGSSNLDQLNRILRETIMIRRKKKNVLDELPDKRKMCIHLEINNRNEYNVAERNFKQWIESHEKSENWLKAEALIKAEKLSHLAANGKLNELYNWVSNAIEQERKIVIFAHHRDIQKQIYEKFKDDSIRIKAGMGSTAIQNAIDDFNSSSNINICVVSTTVGGEAINLQSADTVVFAELEWTPSAHSQAEDRVHRMGQTKTVDVYYLIADNTIEEKIFNVIDEKQKQIDQAINGMTGMSKTGFLTKIYDERSE